MLSEITRTRQVPGEPYRRWFFSHEQDLLVWFGEDGAPIAFQLAYGKDRSERAIRWKAGRGYSHYTVDDGEGMGAVGMDSPILLEGGVFPVAEVLRRFIELSDEMPRDLTAFVAARLREHPDYRGIAWFDRPGIASGIAAGLAIAVAGLAVVELLRRRRK